MDWVVHVPVIIRGVRRNGRNRGMPYERTKRLPVTDLNVALSRQSEGLSDAQAARNLKASVLAQLGNPEPNDMILELSDETYYLDATREWTFSQQAMQVVDDQVVVDTVLDQDFGALRDVSYQLFCGDEILESAFEQRPDKLFVARQLAELMRLPIQEVLSDFDAITGIGTRWGPRTAPCAWSFAMQRRRARLSCCSTPTTKTTWRSSRPWRAGACSSTPCFSS